MNCFNGQEYLKEALDSVFAQTVEDWEVIFVDNCSTDKSVEIAKGYGEKVRIIRTEQNIPLGAARNFGITHCVSEYISFLDTDDIWFPFALEKQLQAIQAGDFALAYGGYININSKSVQIGKMIPKKKNGNIFGPLLKQFDIPIVTTMISKKYLDDSGLVFDSNIYASEEYCLFMQLAARYPFSAIDVALTRYRIHDGALTNRTISKWAKERRYTLNKIIKDNPGIEQDFKMSFEEAFARAAYYEAQYFMSIKNSKQAADALKPYRIHGLSYFALYLLLRYFSAAWGVVQKFKYGRNI